MRIGRHYWVLGAVCAGLGLSACGTPPTAGTASVRWQSVTVGPLTVSRSATGVVTDVMPTPVVYHGSAALVARSLAAPGKQVPQGAPLLVLSNGETVTAPASGTVTQVMPAGASVGGPRSSTTVAALRPNTPRTVLVSVPAADVRDWLVGTAVSAVDAGPGSVRHLTSAVEGVYQASVVFANDNRLKAGSRIVVTSASERWAHVYRVPAGAILNGAHGGYAVRTREDGRVAVKILGVAPMTVAVQGNLYNHEAVWVPPVAGTRGLVQSSSFLP